MVTAQDKINEFFLELDKAFPGSEFIKKYGIADTFREWLENNIETVEALEDTIYDLER